MGIIMMMQPPSPDLIFMYLFASLILTIVYSASRNNPAYLFNLLDEADTNARANILVFSVQFLREFIHGFI
jgi:hypothetical protein